MSVETKARVLGLLESFTKREKEIALLRYEIEHTAKISPEEMIDAMSFTHGDDDVKSRGHISDKTLYIALNYQERLDRINRNSTEEIAEQLVRLENEQNRLLYYVSLLKKRQSEVIKLFYFMNKVPEEIANELAITSRTVRRIRGQAIDKLVEMYSYAENLTKK